MKISIDTDKQTLSYSNNDETIELALYTDKAFEIISSQWINLGWNQKYIYTFSWLGRPIIQLPDDMIRAQEAIWKIQPDVIFETGIAHGGSLIFYASLCKAIGKGRVIGVDIDIRPHNRKAIESHPLFEYITLVEGSSIDPDTVSKIDTLIDKDESAMVFLDSCHTKDHVAKELEAYHHLVSKDSYIIATDGIMQDVHSTPRGEDNWATDHPSAAAIEFAKENSQFELEQPSWPFNESTLDFNLTHWPSAWLKRT
jgi:cephalosporin hydroxylase